MVRCALPLVIFAYNRPDQFEELIGALKAQRFAAVYVFIDGPKGSKPHDIENVERVRDLAETLRECTDVLEVSCQTTNQGLKRQVTHSLGLIFQENDSAIILEDDCIPSPTFFPFCEEMIEKYRTDVRVARIGGYAPEAAGYRFENSYSFVLNSGIWGWATWADRWHLIGPQIFEYRFTLRSLASLLARMPGFLKRLQYARTYLSNKSLDSWGIPFTAICRSAGLLGVTPSVNLVSNIGVGTAATHMKRFDPAVNATRAGQLEFPLKHPVAVKRDIKLERAVARSMSKHWLAYWLRLTESRVQN